MPNFEENEQIDDVPCAVFDDEELDANEDILSPPDRNLMPELPLERQISETEIQKAIEKFPLNFSYVYPSSGPALYMDSLDQAMKHSIFSSDEQRPLLIYLHRNATASTHIFCKDVLCNEEIIKYLAQYYLVWAWDCTKDANYSRFLLMLLQHAGCKVTTMVAEIPMDDYPLLLCLLHEHNEINVIKIIGNSDNSTSPDETYIRLIQTRERFDVPPNQVKSNEKQYSSVDKVQSSYCESSELVLLDQQIDEFKNVAHYFTDFPGQIIRIERIENKQWLKTYQKMKNTIDTEVGHDRTEQILFHGCLPEASQTILQRGFNNQLIGIHGTECGHGFYFSTNPKRSHMYALPNLSRGGERTMFKCRVITGETYNIFSTMDTPPILYNSKTDGSQIYVVFSNEQILPEYLITYK